MNEPAFPDENAAEVLVATLCDILKKSAVDERTLGPRQHKPIHEAARAYCEDILTAAGCTGHSGCPLCQS